ncbi:MAG TPA: DUF1353 domain-containing protein [Saccharofermentans sp.]|nr:DUF1353 domain-containing protein [Saccharofermentans sp.]
MIKSSSFTHNYPLIRQIESREYRLEEDFLYCHRLSTTILIKEGFWFDGASIPVFAWSLVGSPFTGKYTVAALLHDGIFGAELFPRKQCDIIFKEAMEDWQTPWIQRTIMYHAVDKFSWQMWNRHTKESIDKHRTYVKLLL